MYAIGADKPQGGRHRCHSVRRICKTGLDSRIIRFILADGSPKSISIEQEWLRVSFRNVVYATLQSLFCYEVDEELFRCLCR
ncbi:hypothetical protein Y032_0041g447 [Ancylostoma ceylanicum]|uniref:Uncharacterized protein n=1 Tax=Ancylostoma ceylanicum TaxID=53326 RepID=A0A016UG13_9BILA|nr:hypothetical protein Y032_0041g447 [Ancylostoma ceylanicum]